MNQDEIRSKSSALAELYTARANGKTLQHEISLTGDDRWIDHVDGSGPNLASDLSCWRVKPEPQRVWVRVEEGYVKVCTYDQALAEGWRCDGHRVIETVEVLP
jgi:hypothetical protein